MIIYMCEDFKHFLPHKNRGFSGRNGKVMVLYYHPQKCGFYVLHTKNRGRIWAIANSASVNFLIERYLLDIINKSIDDIPHLSF